MFQIRLTKLNATLVVLSLSFAVFNGSIFLSIFVQSEDTYFNDAINVICYSFYCWMFAINPFIYVVISEDFREIYKLFLCDVYDKLVNKTPAENISNEMELNQPKVKGQK